MLLNAHQIDPCLLGTKFQEIITPQHRRNFGIHYTDEKKILKLIKPLFLDDLYLEFNQLKNNCHQLQQFQRKIAALKFLDPACGCGNFLVVTYRELRELEIKVLRQLWIYKHTQIINQVNQNQLLGIEIDQSAIKIARIALQLIEQQMNDKISNEFGQYCPRIPITNSANIVHGNALQIDWESVVNGGDSFSQRREGAKGFECVNQGLSFILGNPPFVGKSYQNAEQKADMNRVFNGVKGAGVLDYVTAWYLKAAQLIQNTKIRCAFVSTSSISQGEQVGILWQELYTKYQIKIHFAHRTFSWSNEAKAKAAVHCVIIGFGLEDIDNKRIFDYVDIKGEPTERIVKNINPYLVEGSDLIILGRKSPISNVPNIIFGSMPNDGGNFLFTETEKNEFIKNEPEAEQWIKPFLSAREFLNNEKRYCLWLVDIQPQELKRLRSINKRVENVKKLRQESKREATKKLSNFPTLFGENRQPNTNYLLLPRVSSEKRKYIPMGFFPSDYIASDSCLIIPNATLYLFGILTSEMHTTWVKYVCGRLKSDYRYSNTIVYNNYPFPENITDKQKHKVETCAQIVLDTRAKYPNSSLADLYDPLTMPPDLVKAHQNLDKAVDLCYRSQPFVNELNRIEFLFNLYENLSTPLLKPEKKKRKSRQK